ncbi:MAG: hypothetical protein ACTHJ4_06270 [Candidatus Nucleicultricaceae bacterium]
MDVTLKFFEIYLLSIFSYKTIITIIVSSVLRDKKLIFICANLISVYDIALHSIMDGYQFAFDLYLIRSMAQTSVAFIAYPIAEAYREHKREERLQKKGQYDPFKHHDE